MGKPTVGREEFFNFYNEYTAGEHTEKKRSGGGDFYSNQNTRVGEYFSVQVIRAALEGRIGFHEAYELTDLHGPAFQEYANRVGIELS